VGLSYFSCRRFYEGAHFILSRKPTIRLTLVARSNYHSVKTNGLISTPKRWQTYNPSSERNQNARRGRLKIRLYRLAVDQNAAMAQGDYYYLRCKRPVLRDVYV
ncbi:uncharacterized protein N7496_004524, partial [Penicillium cataractarum]